MMVKNGEVVRNLMGCGEEGPRPWWLDGGEVVFDNTLREVRPTLEECG